jgi:hypothetical protein
VVPKGYYQDTKMQIIKDASKRFGREKKKEVRDYWFNRLWARTKPKQTWQEKWLAKEENCSSGDSSGEEEVEDTSDKGGGNLESGNGNPGEEENRQEEQLTWMDVKMVFMIPVEFHTLAEDIA